MKIDVFKKAYSELNPSRSFIFILIVLFFVSCFSPSDPKFQFSGKDERVKVIRFIDNYERFLNTFAQALIPIVLGDKIGLVQSAYVGLSTTIITHGFKNLYNQLGFEFSTRPTGAKSNMPSGHSSMAACGMAFVIRRYGWRFKYGFILILTTLGTMFARVELSKHTLSAIFAGCIVGVFSGYCFASKTREKLSVSLSLNFSSIRRLFEKTTTTETDKSKS
jgi:membrane-associated phospholipid phosphatase